ncbi:bifunctional 2-C-methyl-D-erythritol 4-phosphate cytidylyltransferase/2-C-methyl-D-erythritol 2,4-cyclodiphosphate synthase [Sandarakinorhabdus limnophila]|uniref:bifunctional 2-C-methyl-D-erythritol 4-phosphate cytidylyltransferase/2-C-methyl-D-erythritol 2,4-cyclodiphosphate synthase n=1 Tax=Sandarakinorhabdus limnophila TaxID=210512 RepID=UPI0031380D46
MLIHAIIVAAGAGLRAGGGVPKQYRAVAGQPLLRHAVKRLLGHPAITGVSVVINPECRALYDEAVAGLGLSEPIVGGATRQESVLAGLEALAADPPNIVLVHDAARAFVPDAVIDALVAAFDDDVDGACPALPQIDSLRRGEAGRFCGSVDRDNLWRVQTPQAFRYPALLAAHRAAAPGATDEVAIALAAGLNVAITPGDERAFKVTEPDDFAKAEAMTTYSSRAASGFDVHKFGPGTHVWLCGVQVLHDHGLIGHSDADAGLHALTDALLGTIAAGDIGDHFPPSDERWRGAASDQFLAHAATLVRERGGLIDHVDVTLICERPKVGPHREAMRTRIAEILGLGIDRVSVKATTTEKLGFTGRQEGVAAQAMASVRLPESA